jgi:hypothetical protein
MPTYSTQHSFALPGWVQHLEPIGWALSLLCFLLVGMIAVSLPKPILGILLLGIASGPMLHLARRTARTALLILVILLSECFLSWASQILSPVLHLALFQGLFALVLWSLGHSFAALTNRRREALVIVGMLWTLSGAACLAALVLLASNVALLSAGVQSSMLARLPLIDLIVGLGAVISSFGLPLRASYQRKQHL